MSDSNHISRKTVRNLQKNWVIAMVLASLMISSIPATPASAAPTIPKILNYQARITDSAGVPVPDGNLNIWISVYDAPSSGTCLYAMQGSCGTPDYKTVNVVNGVFSMLIGDMANGDNEIPDTLFSNPGLYLGVTVASDTEMVPRKRITAAPYAVNADQLDGLDATDSGSTTPYIVAANANGNLVITGDPQGGLVSSGSVYINPGAASASETLFGIADNGASRWMIDKEGDITHTGSLLATAASSTAQFVFRGAASQSNNIFEVQSDDGGRRLGVSATSTEIWGSAINLGADLGTTTVRHNLAVDLTLNVLGNAQFGNASSTDSVSFDAWVATNFTPATDATYDLGDHDRRWRDLWISGGTIHIGDNQSDEGVIAYDTTANRIVLGAIGGVQVGDLTITGTCTGCGGGVANLQAAYNAATSTTELSISGGNALTIADTLSGVGNIFEIQDLTNPATGDWSRRYLTVSSTSTSIFGNTVLGDASGDSVTFNAATWSIPNTTAVSLNDVANALNFDTNTLTIDALNNRVGIGTATPSSKLHVHNAAEAIRITGSGTTGAGSLGYMVFYDSNNSTRRGYVGDAAITNTDLYLHAETGKLRLGDSASSSTIVASGAKVGIGTDEPAVALDILAANAQQLRLRSTSADATLKNGYLQVGHYTNSEEDFVMMLANANSSTNILHFGGGSAALNTATQLSFYTAANNTTTTGTEQMRLDSSGNLSIGGTSASAKLTVISAANDEAIAVTGYSLTGSAANPLLTMSGTWNTSGAPIGVLLNITDTASNGNSTLMTLQQSSVTRFNFRKDGRQSNTGNNSSTAIASGYFGLDIINSNLSPNNLAGISFGDGAGTSGAGIQAQFLNHATDTSNLIFATTDNAGTYATRMTVGATTTSIVGDLSVSGTISGNITTSLNQAYLNSTSTTEIFLTPSQGALTVADTFSGTGNIFEIQDRTNPAGDWSRKYFTVSSTSTRIDGPSTYDLTVNAVVDTGITISRSNTTRWRLRNDFGGAGASDAFVISEGIATPRLSIMPTLGWVGINTDAPNATLEVRTVSDSVTHNIFSVTNASDSARYLTVSSTSANIAYTGAITGANGALNLTTNGITSGMGLQIQSSATAFTGNLAYINLSGNNANNTGSLLQLNSGGSNSRAKLLEMNSASANSFGGTGAVRLNLTGNHSFTGFQIDDVTTNGTAMLINASAIQTGYGLMIDSTTATSMGVGSVLKVVGPSTCCSGANSNGIVADFRMNGNPTGNNSAAMVWMAANGLTTGKILNVSGSDVMTSGTLVDINTRAATLTSGSLLSIRKTSTSAASVTYTGNIAEISYEQIFNGGGVNTGRTFDVSRNLTINGAAASPVIAGAVARFSDNLTLTQGWIRHGANVVSITQDFIGATNTALSVVSSATGGGGAYVAGKFEPLTVAGMGLTPTSNLFQVQNQTNQATGDYSERYLTVSSTTTGIAYNAITDGTAASITADALTTGTGLSIASAGTGLTSGSLLSLTTATTGAVATNGIVSLNATGNFTSTSNVGLLNITANATARGTLFSVSSSTFKDGVMMSATATAMDTGTAMRISTPAVTTGSALHVVGPTGASSMGGGNGLVAITSSGNFTSTTNRGGLLRIDATGMTAATVASINDSSAMTGNGRLLALTADAATTATQLVAISANGLTTGGALSITSSGNVTTAGGSGRGTLLEIQKTGTATTGTFSGSIARINYAPTYTTTSTTNSGNALLVSRAVTNNGASTNNITGAVVSFTDDGTQTSGTLNNSANVLSLTQNYAAATGAVLQINNAGSGFDVRGTSGTWSVDKDGNATFASCTGCGGGGGTLQQAYDNDADGGDVTITTNATDGALVIAGDQAFNITTSGATTISNAFLVNGNTTLGDASGDSVTTNASTWTVNNALNMGLGTNKWSITSTSSVSNAIEIIGNSISSASVIAGVANGLTSGNGEWWSSSAAYSGNLMYLNPTANYTGDALDITANSTQAGTGINMTMNGLTTGKGINITSSGALTSGNLLSVSSSASSALSSGIVRIASTGGYTSSSSSTGMLTLYSQTSTSGTMLGLNGDNTSTGTLIHLDAHDLSTGSAIVARSYAGVGFGLTTGSLLDLDGYYEHDANEVGSMARIMVRDKSDITSATIGLLIQPEFSSASANMTRTLTGMKIDPSFAASGANCNSTAVHLCVYNGIELTTPSRNVTTANTTLTFNGLNLSSSGALNPSASGAYQLWKGINLTMPSASPSGSAVVSATAISITGPLTVGSTGAHYSIIDVATSTFSVDTGIDKAINLNMALTSTSANNTGLLGININPQFNLFSTGAGTKNIVGLNVENPTYTQCVTGSGKRCGFYGAVIGGLGTSVTHTSNDTLLYHGIDINQESNSFTQSGLAGTVEWRGISMSMPNITQTTGTVTSVGLEIIPGTVNSGTAYAITTGSASDTLAVDFSGVRMASNLTPTTDNTYDLGDWNRRWRDLYLGPGSLHIGTSTGDEVVLSYDMTAKQLVIRENGALAKALGGVGAVKPLRSWDLGTCTATTGDYNMGYSFTPLTDGYVTALGSRKQAGTQTVRLYEQSGGTELASASVVTTGNTGDFVYTDITPVAVSAGTNYVVAVRGNSTYCYNGQQMPKRADGVTINDSRYVLGADTIPTNIDTANMYGQADIVFQSSDLSDAQNSFVRIGNDGQLIYDEALGVDNKNGYVHVRNTYSTSVSQMAIQSGSTGFNANDGLLLNMNGLTASIINNEASYLALGTSGLNRMIVGSNGNVGIGTDTTPDNYLEVEFGTTGVGSNTGISIRNTSTGDAVLDFSVNGVTTPTYLVGVDNSNSDYFMFRYNATDFDSSGGDSSTLLTLDGVNDRVCVGLTFCAANFQVIDTSAEVMRVNRDGTDGDLITFYGQGIFEGSISISGATISYNAFTGSHYAWSDEALSRGELVSMTGENRLSDPGSTEPVYGVVRSTQPNDPKILGAFLGLRETSDPYSATNTYLVMAVGNGEMWVVDEGENISVGDNLISSGTAGHAMKDIGAYPVSHIVGRATESVDWESVTDTIGGKKRKKITVTYEVFHRNNLGRISENGAFMPTATASATSTAFSSFGLTFAGSAWDSGSSTAVTRNLTLANDITSPEAYQFSFRNHAGDLLAALNQSGDLAIAGTLSVEGGFDYAEMFPSVPDLEAGDIVMVDAENRNGYGVKKTQVAYENAAIGVISTKPGFLTGDRKAEGAQPVALAGRVPVKVNMENGSINPGDPITSSSTPGIGMKAAEAGRVIGIALQGATQPGTVLIFVNPSWWNGPMPVDGAVASSSFTVTQDSLLDFKNSVLSNVAAIISTNGSWSVTSDGQLAALKVEAKDIVAETFTVKAAAAAPERTVGVGRIQAGYDAALVQNAKVKPDSLIVVTFEGNPGANWWIDEKLDGHFVLKLAQGAHTDLKFTYWIVPIEGALDPTADEDGSASGTDEVVEPEPDPEPEPGPEPEGEPSTPSATGTPETGGETESGSGTDETP